MNAMLGYCKLYGSNVMSIIIVPTKQTQV